MKKRILATLLCLILMAQAAMAEPRTVDLDTMTLAELQELQLRVLAAMWASDGWQEVEVPVGAYKVGVEIPAGKWTIRPVPGQYAEVYVSTKLNAAGTDAAGDWLTYQTVCDKDCYMHEYFPVENITVDVKAGQYIVIEDAAVLFTPYSGPSFSFK